MGAKAKNPFVGVNYINDNAKMAIPPAYVLQRFYDFDNQLVLFPSRNVPYAYVIARRRRTAGLTDKALEQTVDQPDTKMVMAAGCVPVTMLYNLRGMWSEVDNVIEAMRRRDTWAVGGGEKAADLLDKADADREAKNKKAIRDDFWNRSGDAWRSYQARTGQRTAYRGGGPRTERRTVTSSKPSESTAGSGPSAMATS